MQTIMNDTYFINKGFEISTDKALLEKEMIFKYLNVESYWAKDIAEQTVIISINNSMCFGVYKDGKQIGFARVVTDKATFAYLCDVFVLDEFRGLGLSKWLLQTILAHQDLQGLRRWLLATADAHGLYNQFGFMPLTSPERWMGIYTAYRKD